MATSDNSLVIDLRDCNHVLINSIKGGLTTELYSKGYLLFTCIWHTGNFASATITLSNEWYNQIAPLFL